MIKIPEGISGKELFAFLNANKVELIKQKSAFPKTSGSSGIDLNYSVKTVRPGIKEQRAIIKAAGGNPQSVTIDDTGELKIVAIANAANWIDSQMDLLLPDCWKKTIKESGPAGKDRIYHLKNHKQDTDGIIGNISDLYSQDYSLTDLGIQMIGITQCLVMESTVEEKYSDKTFDLYTDKRIKQHSIGLQYVKMDLAVNDPNYPNDFAIWNKYYAQVINKDVANNRGYFWVIYEIKLLEVSAVLWGANELTPCIDNEEDEDITEGGKTESVSEMIKNTKIKIAL